MPVSSVLSSVSNTVAGKNKAGTEEERAEFSYEKLNKKYDGFSNPQAQILLGGEIFSDKTNQMIISEVSLELSSGYEASVARFRIYNAYDSNSASFLYENIQKQVALGQTLTVCLGYAGTLEPVFTGFVAGLDFIYETGDLPCIEVTGMDVKGIMMANRYSSQLTSSNYSDAVKEILQRIAYENLKTAGGYLDAQVTDTPDKTALEKTEAAEKLKGAPGGGKLSGVGGLLEASGAAGGIKGAEGTATMEMVAESDYEFIVKAAKKYNFEFFVDRGIVYFRKAKSNAKPLIRLGIGTGLKTFDIGYSISGLAGSVEARTVDAGTGKLISGSSSLSGQKEAGEPSQAAAEAVSAVSGWAAGVAPGAVSAGENDDESENLLNSKANHLISTGKKVYVDPSIRSLEDAKARADSLMETMAYRLGSLECECVGIPELAPGRFLDISGLGSPAENRFYVTDVIHSFTTEHGYQTKIRGKARKVRNVGEKAEEGKEQP